MHNSKNWLWIFLQSCGYCFLFYGTFGVSYCKIREFVDFTYLPNTFEDLQQSNFKCSYNVICYAAHQVTQNVSYLMLFVVLLLFLACLTTLNNMNSANLPTKRESPSGRLFKNNRDQKLGKFFVLPQSWKQDLVSNWFAGFVFVSSFTEVDHSALTLQSTNLRQHQQKMWCL